MARYIEVRHTSPSRFNVSSPVKLTRTSAIVIAVMAWLMTAMKVSLAGDINSPWNSARELSPGVLYLHAELEEPRKMVVNCLRIDSQTPHLKLITTPRYESWELGKTETKRQTVRNFIRQSQATSHRIVAAINADAFSPWPVPYQNEDPTDLNGLAISEGQVVSLPTGTPSFLVMKTGVMLIDTVKRDADLSGIETAVSGFSKCLVDGIVPPTAGDLHPRTGLGLSHDQRYLYLLTIDGRQPSSLGATVQDVGQLLKDYGADDGINMDGGGSTTLAWWNPNLQEGDRCELLNRPVGSGKSVTSDSPTVPTERANGNNLGIYYLAP